MKKATAATAVAANVWQEEFKANIDQMKEQLDLMLKVLQSQVQATTQAVVSTRRIEESMNKIETQIIPELRTEVLTFIGNS